MQRWRVMCAVMLVAGCATNTVEPVDTTERVAEIQEITAPAFVAGTDTLRVMAKYGRGACDIPRRLRTVRQDGAQLGMRVTPNPTRMACIDLLVLDTISITVPPPYTLPYVVVFERPEGRDTTAVIRER